MAVEIDDVIPRHPNMASNVHQFQQCQSQVTGTILFPEETSIHSSTSLCTTVHQKPSLRLIMPSISTIHGGAGDLNTPLPPCATRPARLSDPATLDTPALITTSGLFNLEAALMDTGTDPLMSKQMTTAEESAARPTPDRQLNLESLDPSELETLLAELAEEEAADDAAPRHGLRNDSAALVPERAVSLDHDYCTEDEDSAIFSEFMDLTRPCLDTQNSTFNALGDGPFKELAVEKEQTVTEGFLGTQGAAVLDTHMDLAPVLLASFAVPNDFAFPAAPVSVTPTPAKTTKDSSYWERRQKNNVASQASRRTRKEKRLALETERDDLGKRNADLKADIARLETLATEWKGRLLKLIG